MRPESETATVHAIRFDSLEGLRAVLAWWVVLGHLVQAARLSPKEIPDPFDFIRMAMHPVYVFMALSGFVIAHLVTSRNEPYLSYIFRRYMRLAPVMLLGMSLSGLLFLAGDRFNFPRSDLLEHTLLHVTLMHGAVPDNMLAFASTSFIGPAWSISLEWQFYVAAPFIIHAITGNGRGALVCAAIAILLIAIKLPLDLHTLGEWEYRKPSMFLTAFPLFAVGILTYQAAKFVGVLKGDGPAFLLGLSLAALWPPVFIAKLGWAITVGVGLIFYLVVWRDSFLSRVLSAAPLAYLGRISYSTYLLHFPIVLLVAKHAPRPENDWLALAEYGAIAAPIILLVSMASYHLVEKPCIEWAARKVKAWRKTPAPVKTS